MLFSNILCFIKFSGQYDTAQVGFGNPSNANPKEAPAVMTKLHDCTPCTNLPKSLTASDL